MVDLKSQYDKIKNEVNASIQEVLDTNTYINGPLVHQFQADLEKYLGVKHVIPCANGTDALQIAMMGLDLKPGDEVITADFTFAATVEVIALLQLTPVLVDVDLNNMNISLEGIRRAITPKTKAIVPVHLFGRAANMDAIMEIAAEHNLYVIEDNAQSIGAIYTFSDGKQCKTGSMGHLSTTSFFPSKNLGAYGDAGAVMTNDASLAEKLKQLANHGQTLKYQHGKVGINSRLDSIQAAVLQVKLKHLEAFISERQAVAKQYDQAFSTIEGVRIPKVMPYSSHVYHQYTLVLDCSVDALRKALLNEGVASMVYYPMPINEQLAYMNEQALPVSKQLSQSVLSLPIGTDMTQTQIQHIIQSFKNSIQTI